MEFALNTPLDPEECLTRLRRVSEAPRPFNNAFRKDRPPLARIERDGEILLWRNTGYNNSLHPILRLRLTAAAGGAHLSGRFEIHPLNFWLLALWYLVLFYILFFRAPAPDADPGTVFRFALNTGLGLGAPFFVWALGSWLARGEKGFVAEAVWECLRP